MTKMIFPPKTVYLAGPITGLSYGEARHGWRQEFASHMPPHIHCLSPMRAKDFLLNQGVLRGDPGMYPEHVLASPAGIVTRDHNDVRTCDAMVACLLDAQRASVGTCIEFGWAHAYRKPVIMIIENDGLISERTQHSIVTGSVTTVVNPHWHAMLSQIAGYRVPTLEEAAHIIMHLLTPGI